MSNWFCSELKAFFRDRAGNVATIFALCIPGVIVVSLGSIELMNLGKDRSRLQDIADATALNAASQMRLAANNQLLERASALATHNAEGLTATMERPEIRFMDGKDGPSGIEVTLTARRTSFFGNLLPPGGFTIRVVSRAQQLGSNPLCVLGLSRSSTEVVKLSGSSITARSCLVHSNKDIRLSKTSLIDAAAVQAAGGISGEGTAMNPGQDAPALDDPLQGMFLSNDPGPCEHKEDVKVDGPADVEEVEPGVHCRKFDIEKGTLRFLPGVHHLKGDKELQLKSGKVEGDNVTIIIWDAVKVTFDSQLTSLDLGGSEGGVGEQAHWAGFALAIHPDWRYSSLKLDFREFRRLEGVVYAPATRLVVPGGIDSAEVTPWTVIVTQELHVEGGRSLQINADYASSALPVPNGVGNKSTEGAAPVRLTH